LKEFNIKITNEADDGNLREKNETDEVILQAKNEAEEEVILQAKKKAMRLLEFMDRTEKQLRDKLKEGEFPPFAIEEAIAYVKSYHYLDDRRFAESYIRNRKDSKSSYQIRMELSEKGVSSELISELIDAEEWDSVSVVASLFRKKYSNKDPKDPKSYEKAFRYFSARGFHYDEIKKGLEAALEDAENDE